MAENATEIVTNEVVQKVTINENNIKNLTYVIRGQQVMLDSDLAYLYQVETRTLNQAVERNIARFPESFRFQFTEEEYANLKSQFVISSLEDEGAHGGRRYLPSLQDAGKKCFAINRIEDEKTIESIVERF